MLDIRYSSHARTRMLERGISEKEIEKALTKGTKSHQDGKIVVDYSYFRVVCKVLDGRYYVITVMERW